MTSSNVRTPQTRGATVGRREQVRWLESLSRSSQDALSLFYCELQHGYEPTGDRQAQEGRRSMLNFFKVTTYRFSVECCRRDLRRSVEDYDELDSVQVPIALFMFLLVGCLQCANVCLYMLIVLPIRILMVSG